MKEILLSIALFLLISCNAYGQSAFGSSETEEIISDIEQLILSGEKRSLRDIATFLHLPAYFERIQKILIENTFFSEEEIDLNENLTKENFLSFYYDYEDQIKYSTSLQSFYITPFEERKANIEVKDFWLGPKEDKYHKFKKMSLALEEGITKGDEGLIYHQIEMISELRMKEGYEYLLDVLKDKRIEKYEFKKELYRTLYFELLNQSTIEIVKIILGHVKSRVIEPYVANEYLSYMTNIYISEDNPNKYIRRYNFYIDSLKTIDGMVNFGFEKMPLTQENFFYETVDYYGKILTESDRYPFVRHNAINKLKSGKHPRALLYIANHIYKIQKNNGVSHKDRTWEYYYKALDKLTKNHISFQKKDKTYTSNLRLNNDRTSFQNFILYWNTHYNDYEWNEAKGVFVNIEMAKEKSDNYEKYFKQLNSNNDSIAFNAFKILTKGDPNQIIPLAKKYKRLLRNYNTNLPSLKSKFLQQLVQLTDYAKKNHISTSLRKKQMPSITKLGDQNLDAAERYLIENEVLEHLNLDNVTAFEFYVCLNEKNKDLSYSAGRILKKFYHSVKHEIFEDESQLRHYLKKSHLFRNIEAMGFCNDYVNLFEEESNQEMIKKIDALRKVEFDKDIHVELFRMKLSISGSNNEQIDQLLVNPLEYDKNKLKRLTMPSSADLEKIAIFLKENRSPQQIRPVLEFLKRFPKLEQVPMLIDLTLDDRYIVETKNQKLRVSDLANEVLENIYDFSFISIKKEDRPKRWNELWQLKSRIYENWSKLFYDELVKRVKIADKINVNDINAIFASTHFKKSDKSICLTAIKKLKPSKLNKLNTKHKLIAKTDLVHFENIKLNYKNLDNLPKYFSETDNYEVLNFMFKKAKDFDLEDRGAFYNNLFKFSWFTNYATSSHFNPEYRKEIVTTLKAYLNESDFISEFEERKSYLHTAMLENTGASLEERIEKSINLDIDESTKASIQQNLISTIKYKEIPVVINYLDQLSVTDKYNPVKFLNTDFGLPIFDLSSNKAKETLLKRHKKMSEKDFYLSYLRDFGVDFTSNKGKLDYKKIGEILQYDIITPFVSESGGTLDLYSYSIVKVLEKEFKTTLGFHQKLNESQTFFLYSNTKRANAWLGFLQRKKLITGDSLSNSPVSSSN